MKPDHGTISRRKFGQIEPDGGENRFSVVPFDAGQFRIRPFWGILSPDAAEKLIGQTLWRRERDSNPRWSFPHSGFQDRRFQPLTHPSGGLV